MTKLKQIVLNVERGVDLAVPTVINGLARKKVVQLNPQFVANREIGRTEYGLMGFVNDAFSIVDVDMTNLEIVPRFKKV